MDPTENTYILEGASPSTTSGAFTISKPGESPKEITGSPEDTRTLIDNAKNKPNAMSNLHQTGFNYVNSIIGSGVIGIPYALRRSGFGLGVILLLVIALMNDYSLCILVQAGNLAGVSTYQDLVQAAFGKWGFYLLTVIQFIYPFIAMISYNVIIGDTATKVFRRVFGATSNSALGNRNTVIFLGTILVTLPLSMQRNIAKLNKVSLLSLVFIVFIMTFIIYRIFSFGAQVPLSNDAYTFASGGITEAIGIIAFAYMCQHNSFLLYESLENPTQQRWNKVTHFSLAVSCLVVMVFGIAGYITFTGFTQGDLLENYCIEDDWANISRLFFCITIMLTYPIECFVVREVFENAVWAGKVPDTKSHNIMVTTIIVTSAFLLSTLTDCLGIVLELNGIYAAVPLAYILPAATYLKLDNSRLLSWRKLPAWILVVFGVAVALSGSIFAFLNVLRGATCSHGLEMPYCAKDFLSNNLESHNSTGF